MHEKACQRGEHWDCPTCGERFTTKRIFKNHRKTCPAAKGEDTAISTDDLDSKPPPRVTDSVGGPGIEDKGPANNGTQRVTVAARQGNHPAEHGRWGDGVRDSKSFAKGIAKYQPNPEKLAELVDLIRRNHETGPLLVARKFRGIRHLAFNGKLTLFYAYCPETRTRRTPGTCPWCSEGAEGCTGAQGVKLLNFDKKHVIEHIR